MLLNAPVLSKDNIQEYITFADGIIKANVPDINKNEEPFNLVTTYQSYLHSNYSAVTNICVYFSKPEDGTSEAMKEVGKDTFNRGVSDYERTKAIFNRYTYRPENHV